MLKVTTMNKKYLLIVILITSLFSFLIFKKYKSKNETIPNYYILQVGAYKSYDSVNKITKNYDNYIVKEEEELFKVFIGITKSDEVYDKLINLYGVQSNNFKKKIKIKDKDFSNKIDKYDELIKKIDNKNKVDLIMKAQLKELDKILK